MALRLILLFHLIVLAQVIALAGPGGGQVQDISGTEIVPRYIYSWTTPESLLKRSNDLKPSQKWPSFPSLKEAAMVIVDHWPALRQSKWGALFGWSTPSATRAARAEVYGEVLVRFEIDPAAVRALLLQPGRNGGGRSEEKVSIDLASADLVFHKSRAFQEWVLLNPAIVKSVTADPLDMKNELLAELEKIKDNSYRFTPDETHNRTLSDPDFKKGGVIFGQEAHRNYAAYRIERFLKEGARVVPDAFLNPKNRKAARTEEQLRSAIRRFKMVDERRYIEDLIREQRDNLRNEEGYDLELSLRDLLAHRLAFAEFSKDIQGEKLESLADFETRIEEILQRIESDLRVYISEKSIKIYYAQAKDFLVNPEQLYQDILSGYVRTAPRPASSDKHIMLCRELF